MSLDHAGALWAILGDPDNRPGRSKSRIPHSQEDMKEFIRESLRKRIPFVLVDHRSGELVGTISLRNLKPHNQSAEICYILISKKHWGQKYAAEATWLLLRYCFEDLQCHRVQVEVAEDSAAQRLVE
jgi:RimJ/RimL family protein N-acetyltransferase